MEKWRPIRGALGYEVSNRGQIRSFWTGRGRHARIGSDSRILKLHTNRYGHATINFGHGPTFYVHHLVLEAFVGPCPPGKECRHLDSNPSNNKLRNLAWGTREENIADRWAVA